MESEDERDDLQAQDDREERPGRVSRWLRRQREGLLAPSVVVIEPRRETVRGAIADTWRYRALILYFGIQALRKFTRGTILGWLWIPLRPVLSICTRAFVFGSVLDAPSGGVPYFLFFCVGVGAWQLFFYIVRWSTRCMMVARKVLTRMYVPRLTVLLSVLVPAGVNFFFYLLFGLGAVGFYAITTGESHVQVGINTLLIPAGLTIAMLLGLGIGAYLSIYAARARDVVFVTGYGLRYLFYVSPIIYPLAQTPGGFNEVIALNPLTAPIEMVRIGAFGTGSIPLSCLISTGVALVVLCVTGLRFFLKAEARALDGL